MSFRWLKLRRRLELLVGGPEILIAVLVVLALLTAAGWTVYFAERGVNPEARSFWAVFVWGIETLTVGSPWDPISTAGRGAAYVMDFLKPVSIGLIIAAASTRAVQLMLRSGSGKGRAKLKDHIVVCCWSGKGAEIIGQLRRRGDQESRRALVILAELSENPSRDDLTTFVRGDPTKVDDLERASVRTARTVVVLADNSYPGLDVEEVDSRSLLTVLAVESMAPEVYSVVEVIRAENLDHFQRTKADEIVVSSRLTGALLAHSAATHGLSEIVGELLTFPSGNEFYWIPVARGMQGRTFKDVLFDLKEEFDCLAVAVADGHRYETNPPLDRVLRQGERILVISRELPRFAGAPTRRAGRSPVH
ncbi:MAG: TrkA family potassium uptake protein [Actinomycetota bacterium]